jgi:hypothetical protein
MDKLTKYQQIVSGIVTEISKKLSANKTFESLLSIDNQHGQYLVLSDGWEGIERNYGMLVHIEVKSDCKVWLRYDGTDLEIGQELLDKGVQSSDLVLAFHSPQMRKYSGYAIA